MDATIYELVLNYLNQKVTTDLKDEFINAALHFNINQDVYKKYSSVQIECKINNIGNSKIVDYVELCSVYGYILYRLIEEDKLLENERIEYLQIVLEINTVITGYIRNIILEEELFERLKAVTEKINLKTEENEKIIELLNA
ncbi:hypothetical protein [Clostridium sp.]|uniref:hypothetical protein n=1 Tax=Clostridium sp. TaxID=1506 RepID=UPI00262AEE05|nr:hypothetical protein [Clostridium sp.]